MGTPIHDIGCHSFAYTDDKMGMQDKIIFVEILIIQSIVRTYSDYVERCIEQAIAKEISPDYIRGSKRFQTDCIRLKTLPLLRPQFLQFFIINYFKATG